LKFLLSIFVGPHHDGEDDLTMRYSTHNHGGCWFHITPTTWPPPKNMPRSDVFEHWKAETQAELLIVFIFFALLVLYSIGTMICTTVYLTYSSPPVVVKRRAAFGMALLLTFTVINFATTARMFIVLEAGPTGNPGGRSSFIGWVFAETLAAYGQGLLYAIIYHNLAPRDMRVVQFELLLEGEGLGEGLGDQWRWRHEQERRISIRRYELCEGLFKQVHKYLAENCTAGEHAAVSPEDLTQLLLLQHRDSTPQDMELLLDDASLFEEQVRNLLETEDIAAVQARWKEMENPSNKRRGRMRQPTGPTIKGASPLGEDSDEMRDLDAAELRQELEEHGLLQANFRGPERVKVESTTSKSNGSPALLGASGGGSRSRAPPTGERSLPTDSSTPRVVAFR